MRLWKKIVLSILCILVILVGIFAYRQWDNLMVLWSIGKHTTAEIEEMLQENTDARTAAVAGIQVRELTAEEKRAVQSGELDEEEALARIVGIPAVPVPSSGAVQGTPPAQPDAPSAPPPGSGVDNSAELARLVGQIYVLEASYTGKLDEMLDSAIAEYRSLPPELRTTTNKLEIGARYVGVADAMEKSCDEQMATLLSQIERTLIAAGQDTELVGEIKTAYQKEKSLTKDYYLSLYT